MTKTKTTLTMPNPHHNQKKNVLDQTPHSNIPILGVQLRRLVTHHDERGIFTEIFRETWNTGINPVQWNVVTSNAGVLRGVHVHIRHNDYLILLQGHASIGLHDLRKNSPTRGLASIVEMHGDQLKSLTIPHGVAHGFYFHKSSLHLYAVSEYFNPEDELRCHWTDPELKIHWPTQSAQISDCDAKAQSFKGLISQLEPYQPT